MSVTIEIFPCSGGMAEGFRRAGVTFDVAVDKDPDACASYEHNLGHRPIQMDARDLLRMCQGGWSPGPVSLMVADPPCTPWSRAGKRLGTEDERDMLHTTTELIAALMPTAYLIGNVPGLDDSTQWHNVQEALAPLLKAGYCIADYASFDAADFGVPQHRVRPFWFGHLSGPCIRWPLPTHGSVGQGALPGLELKPWVTCREALQRLPLAELGRPVRVRNKPSMHPCSETEKPANTISACMPGNGGNVLLNSRHPPAHPAHPAHPAPTLGAKDRGQGTVLLAEEHPRHPASRPDEPSFTVRTNGGRASGAASMLRLDDPNRPPRDVDEPFRTITRASEYQTALAVRPFHNPHPPSEPDRPARTVTTVQHSGHGGGATSMPWPWDRPSTTVCAAIDKIAPAGEHAGQYGPNAIVLSERAAAILQGFPDGWLFSGATKKARWSQLGQAMPPGLAHAVATSVVEQMAAALKRSA